MDEGRSLDSCSLETDGLKTEGGSGNIVGSGPSSSVSLTKLPPVMVGMTDGVMLLASSSGMLLHRGAVTYSVSTSDLHNSAVTYSVSISDLHNSAVTYSVAASDLHTSAVMYSDSEGMVGSEW